MPHIIMMVWTGRRVETCTSHRLHVGRELDSDVPHRQRLLHLPAPPGTQHHHQCIISVHAASGALSNVRAWT